MSADEMPCGCFVKSDNGDGCQWTTVRARADRERARAERAEEDLTEANADRRSLRESARAAGLALGRAELRAEKAEADFAALAKAVKPLLEDIEQHVDVEDGSDGPRPNWAMRLVTSHCDGIAAALKETE